MNIFPDRLFIEAKRRRAEQGEMKPSTLKATPFDGMARVQARWESPEGLYAVKSGTFLSEILPMTSKAHFRDVQYIPQAKNWDSFQNMCLHVYEELYHSSRLYGRHGQIQHGLDILLNDYRAAPINKHKGMVFVQCKYTSKDELAFAAVKDDVLAARDKIMTSEDYAGVYLYIVVTNTKNDVNLHDNLQKLKVQEGLSFEIELHTWDKVCSLIQKSDRLWELYNDDPGSGVDAGMRVQVHQMTGEICRLVQQRCLADAFMYDQQRRGLRRKPGYGYYATPAPENVWNRSPELRKALLDLYDQAADSRSAFPLLDHEFSLGNMQSVDSCLAYLRSARIVGNLRSPDVVFLVVGDKPSFTRSLEALADKIFEMEGSPEKLACLALILIMESSNPDVQDAALQMMIRLRDRDAGTAWEHTTLIAHAVVRYYYVVRRGWAPMARYYTVGDTLGLRSRIGIGSELLNKPFNHDERVNLTITGVNPLNIPRYGFWGYSVYRSLSRLMSGGRDNLVLPELCAECCIYSSEDYDRGMPHWREYKAQLTDQRVVDFPTLARAAAKNVHRQLLEQYTPVITERTFERLLGYRAYLRAYVGRIVEPDKYAKKLETIESLISACRYPENVRDLGKGAVWVVPVYDNPPRRLDDRVQESGFNRGPFTLATERLAYWRQWAENLPGVGKWRDELEQRYVNRSDEFSLSCLLALHRHQAMLTYEHQQSSQAAQMGIAADYPHRLEARSFL